MYYIAIYYQLLLLKLPLACINIQKIYITIIWLKNNYKQPYLLFLYEIM